MCGKTRSFAELSTLGINFSDYREVVYDGIFSSCSPEEAFLRIFLGIKFGLKDLLCVKRRKFHQQAHYSGNSIWVPKIWDLVHIFLKTSQFELHWTVLVYVCGSIGLFAISCY